MTLHLISIQLIMGVFVVFLFLYLVFIYRIYFTGQLMWIGYEISGAAFHICCSEERKLQNEGSDLIKGLIYGQIFFNWSNEMWQKLESGPPWREGVRGYAFERCVFLSASSSLQVCILKASKERSFPHHTCHYPQTEVIG